MIRSSVQTLDIDGHRDQFYYVDGSGNKVYTTKKTTGTMKRRDEFGYFRGLAWTGANETDRGESSKTEKGGIEQET